MRQQKRHSKGIFNLDYEETVLLRSRLNILRASLAKIYIIALKLLRLGKFSLTETEELREIIELSGKKENWK